jgi:ABC-2 type transport system ATP-binding protein
VDSPVATAAPVSGVATPAVAAIEVAHLRKQYGSVVAVEDVSFTVAKGEVFGLLGPNGAGKTTTVESIVGLRLPDSGTIRVLGLDPLIDGAALREKVGVQLQHGALPPKLRVQEALRLYASFYRHPADLLSLTEALGLSGKERAYFKDLSGGQKQRLSIALGLIGQPEVAVLDEITTGLDPQARRSVWGLIGAMRDRGATIVLVTHAMDEAQRLCDHVALIDAGRVLAVDTPTHLGVRVTGGKHVRFRVAAPFDERLLTRLPELHALEHDGEWMVATGDGDLVNAIILTLAAAGVSVHDVSAESAGLEDAFLAMILPRDGATPGGEPAVDVPPKREREPTVRRGLRLSFRSRRRGEHRPPRTAFRELVRTEARLALRTPVGLFWGVAFPLAMLIVFGSISGTNKADAKFGGLSAFQVYIPIMIAFSLVILAAVAVPPTLASYRELGVLRRMATTPVPPSWLLGAQLALSLVVFVLAVLIVIVGGELEFNAHLAIQPVGFVLSLVLAMAAMVSVGLFIAAIAATQRVASIIGGVIFFPMLFFSGLWLPRESMGPTLRGISDFVALGAAAHALDDSLLSRHFPPAQPLLIMVVWAVGFGWLAVRTFRWE